MIDDFDPETRQIDFIQIGKPLEKQKRMSTTKHPVADKSDKLFLQY